MQKSPFLFAVATLISAGAVMAAPASLSNASASSVDTAKTRSDFHETPTATCLRQTQVSGFDPLDGKHIVVNTAQNAKAFLVTMSSFCHGLDEAQYVNVQANGPSCVSPMDRLLVESDLASPFGCKIETIEQVNDRQEGVAIVRSRLQQTEFNLEVSDLS